MNDNELKYCVYHITYCGDKLPPKLNSNKSPSNYIGSTSVESIKKGYMGTVKSKKYEKIWKSEIQNNRHAFNITIVSYHKSRIEALEKEVKIQKIFNVVKNPLFVNMSYAQVNGYFGRDVSGINNPNYSKGYRQVGTKNGRYGIHDDYSTYKKISESLKGKVFCRDSAGNIKCVSRNEYRKDDTLKTNRYNKILVKNIFTKEVMDIEKNEFYSLEWYWIVPCSKFIYHTPFGKFTNPNDKRLNGRSYIREWCNTPEKRITRQALNANKFSDEYEVHIGKTHRELGFWKEEILW